MILSKEKTEELEVTKPFALASISCVPAHFFYA